MTCAVPQCSTERSSRSVVGPAPAPPFDRHRGGNNNIDDEGGDMTRCVDGAFCARECFGRRGGRSESERPRREGSSSTSSSNGRHCCPPAFQAPARQRADDDCCSPLALPSSASSSSSSSSSLPAMMSMSVPMIMAASPAHPTKKYSARARNDDVTAQQQQQQQQQPHPPAHVDVDENDDERSSNFQLGLRRLLSSHNDSNVPSPPPRAIQRQGSVRRDDPTRFYASLVAGAGSGALASVLCAPLDLVRVRMQVWGQVVRNSGSSGSATGPKDLLQNTMKKARTASASVPVRQLLREIKELEGYRGFFKGLGATLFTVPVFWAIYFPCYDELKSYWLTRINEGKYVEDRINPSLIHMMSAVQAGAIADVVCNPMFVVRTRLQTEALHDLASRPSGAVAESSSLSPTSSMLRPPRTLSIAATVRNLYREGGVRGFWRGMTANLLGLAHVAIQFPLYEHLKLHLKGTKRHESALDLLLASSVSKIAASLVSYPHEVIRSRMMDSRRQLPATFTDTCRVIYRNEGFRGFYAGLPVSVLRVIPNTCVTFVTYELFLRWTKQRLQQQR